MGTTPNYPPALPFNGSESLLIWQDSKQRNIAPHGLIIPTAAMALFSNLSSFTAPSSADVIFSTGHSAVGVGAGPYIADSLATSSLAIACPNFCAADASGRYFRAFADPDALVLVAMGGAQGWNAVPTSSQLGTVNHQPIIQQAIAYAAVIGAKGIRHDQQHYSIWCPQRTAVGGVLNDNPTNHTGIPFPLTGPTEVRSAALGTTYHRRTDTGGDPAVFANTQILPANQANNGNTMPWRGGMFFLVGQATMPADYSTLASITFTGTSWTFDGGLAQSATPGLAPLTGSPAWYVLNNDGSGWDITDKPIWGQNDTYTGDINFKCDVTICRFRGELIYNVGGSVYSSGGKLTLHNTDANGFNAQPTYSDPNNSDTGYPTVQIDHLHIFKVFQALEGGSGWNGFIGRLAIEDCVTPGGYQAGVDNYGAEPAGRPFPMLSMPSIKVQRSGTFFVLYGNRIGSLDCLDTGVSIDNTFLSTQEITIDNCSIVADTITIPVGVNFPSKGVAAGSQTDFNNRIGNLYVGRTANAVANGFAVTVPVEWTGSMGDNCFIDRLSGYSTYGPSTPNVGSVVDYHVGFGDTSGLKISAIAPGALVDLTPTIAFYGPIFGLLVSVGTPGSYPVTLPDMTNKLPTGSKLTLVGKQGSNQVMAIATTNARASARQNLLTNAAATFQWDGAKWMALTPTIDLIGSASLTPASLANGASASLGTITVTGAVVGMKVSVNCTTAQPGILLFGIVTDVGVVTAYATNISGALWNPGALTFTAATEFVN